METVLASEAARMLGISPRRIRALIAAKRLAALKIGRDWILLRADVLAFVRRQPGRPRRIIQ